MTTPPDPTNPDLLDNLRAYLVSQGIVRVPRVAGAAPPMWLAQRQGIPAPGESEGLAPEEVGPTVVLGAAKATGLVPRAYEGFLRNDAVEFTLRTQTANLAYSLENQVRAAINDKRGWMMASVPVNESLIFRDLTPIGSDNTGFLYTFEYMFNLWGPFTPVGP